MYPLQLEEGTPLERLEAAGKIEVPDEDFQAQCMDIAAELLHAHGFERYEVASYAKSGHRCQHNIAYWTGVPYLGLGRSAASMCAATGDVSLLLENTFDGTPDSESDGTSDGAAGRSSANSSTARIRFTQLDDAGEEFDHEFLTPREAMAEDLMLACRMTDGIGPELLARAIRVVPANELSAACDRAVERKLAAWDNGTLKPTHLGWLDGNELFGIFWDLAADA